MQKPETLKDGTEIFIRAMTTDDLQRSFDFFQTLQPEDRAYLRRDVASKAVVKQRILEMKSGNVKRLIALHDDMIVADGALELTGSGWKAHIGELRLIVTPSYRRKGLGMLLARQLYFIATAAKLEQVVAKIMQPQVAGQSIFTRLGFREEATFTDYVKDMSGARQDLVVMRCDLKAMWQELQYFLEQSDWHRTR